MYKIPPLWNPPRTVLGPPLVPVRLSVTVFFTLFLVISSGKNVVAPT